MTDSDTLILIPARMASTRLPGKPLADIGRVADDRARDAGAAQGRRRPRSRPTSSEIAAAVTAAGGRAVMTRSDHTTGSDRIFEALETIDPHGRAKIVVNVQGDFPMLAAATSGPRCGRCPTLRSTSARLRWRSPTRPSVPIRTS